MRDEDLRRLERASAEQGDPLVEARRLLELARRGDLPQERLELAAYVGHAAARVALEGRAVAPPEGVADWLKGLERWGREARLRAAIVLTRVLSRTRGRFEEDDAGRRVLESAEALFLEPSAANKQALDRLIEGPEALPGRRASYIVASLLRAEDSFDDNFRDLAEGVEDQCRGYGSLHERTVRDYVRDDLAPWALGQLDPVATRPSREGKRFSSEDDEIVRSFAFDPSGARLVVANRIGRVRVRSFPSGELVRELPKVSREVFVAVFSPDGSHVLTGDGSGWVRLFLVETGTEVASVRFGEEPLYGLAFLGGRERVAVGAVGGKAAILELGTGRVVVELAGHERTVMSLDVSPSGEHVATASADEKLRLFDAATGALVRTIECGSVEDMAFLPDGRVVTGGSGGVVGLWDVKSGVGDRLETGGATVYAVAASPRGDVVAGAPSDRAPIMVWDTTTGAVRQRFAWDLSIPLALAFSPDGRHLIMGDRGGGVRVFEIAG